MLMLSVSSCGRIMGTAEHFTKKIKKLLSVYVQEASDKIYPRFDARIPDTPANKKRFKDFIQVELTPDVKTIFCFDDAIGLDADYMFAFKCGLSTSNKIIAKHALQLDTTTRDNGFGMQHDFIWWDKARIAQLPKYAWTDGNGYYKYYWYDAQRGQAYFFDFDL